MMTKYSSDVEQKMYAYYRQLNERDRRQYASLEAIKLGFGGRKYIASLFKMSPRTLRKGILELDSLEVHVSKRQRKVGGGRKPFFLPT